MARNLSRIFRGFQRLGSLYPVPIQTLFPASTTCAAAPARIMRVQPSSLYSSASRDFSLPNSSWGPEMMQLYEHYNSLCEVETEGGQKQKGPWMRLPSYDRLHKIHEVGKNIPESNARLFTRSITEEGAAFEYVLFNNQKEKKIAAVFQTGHLVEGPPGVVHGGAIVSMIDTVIASHAIFLCGPNMTVSLNINYRSALLLGSTVLIESCLEKREGRKLFISCNVISADGSVVHAESKALFLAIDLSQLPK